MSKAKIIITFPATKAVLDRAYREFDVKAATDKNMTVDELIRIAKDFQPEGLMISFQQKMTPEVIGQLPTSVKALVTCSVGYDHLNIDAAKSRGLKLANTPDVLTNATADLAMLLLMGASRRLREQSELANSGWGRALGQNEMLGLEISGKRIGILGMGRIGQAMAQRARGFGMEVLYCNRRQLPANEEQGARYFADFKEMLPHCQILSLHAPSSPETEGIMNKETFALLPKDAIFVNVARGSLVNEDALLSSLDSGHLFAAGLDVYSKEPQIDPRLIANKRVLMTPHTGSSTVETRDAMGFKCLDNISAILSGKPALDAI